MQTCSKRSQLISPALAAILVFAVAAVGRCSAAALPVVAGDASRLPVSVSPYDAHLRYDGRFDTSDPAGPKCAWPACAVRIEFKASAVNIKLGETGTGDEYEVIVDGIPTEILAPPDGEHVYAIYAGDGRHVHSVDVVKRTEMLFGTGQVLGFELSAGGKLMQTPAFKRRIEIIGDSMSAGWGDEGKDVQDVGTAANENAYITYGAVAARAFDAGLTECAWSGLTMWQGFSMPDRYDLILRSQGNLKWDFSKLVPDVVLINLGGNDWSDSEPDEKGWNSAYEMFVHRVRAHYPNALIYCAITPMLSGDKLAQESRDLREIVKFENASGDANVKLIVLRQGDPNNGSGSGGHPNAISHRFLAGILIDAIKHDLGWKTVNPKP
jgi:lysophospholipase L1-like esterase